MIVAKSLDVHGCTIYFKIEKTGNVLVVSLNDKAKGELTNFTFDFAKDFKPNSVYFYMLPKLGFAGELYFFSDPLRMDADSGRDDYYALRTRLAMGVTPAVRIVTGPSADKFMVLPAGVPVSATIEIKQASDVVDSDVTTIALAKEFLPEANIDWMSYKGLFLDRMDTGESCMANEAQSDLIAALLIKMIEESGSALASDPIFLALKSISDKSVLTVKNLEKATEDVVATKGKVREAQTEYYARKNSN